MVNHTTVLDRKVEILYQYEVSWKTDVTTFGENY